MKHPFVGHFLMLFTTETNRIENINISYNSTRELFEQGTLLNYTGDLRSALSVVNNKSVAAYLNDCLDKGETVTPELIKEVHRLLMFASIDDHRYHDNGERAGSYKVHDYGVGRLSVGSAPDEVEGDITSLCEVLYDNSDSDPVKLAAVFMCHFEHIHPFADGNGRVGRWVANYILVSKNHTPVVFYSDDRAEYYAALEWFDLHGDYLPMYTYFTGQVEKSKQAVREIS